MRQNKKENPSSRPLGENPSSGPLGPVGRATQLARPAQPHPSLAPFATGNGGFPWRSSTAPWPRWRPSAAPSRLFSRTRHPLSAWNPNPYPLAPHSPSANRARRPSSSSPRPPSSLACGSTSRRSVTTGFVRSGDPYSEWIEDVFHFRSPWISVGDHRLRAFPELTGLASCCAAPRPAPNSCACCCCSPKCTTTSSCSCY